MDSALALGEKNRVPFYFGWKEAGMADADKKNDVKKTVKKTATRKKKKAAKTDTKKSTTRKAKPTAAKTKSTDKPVGRPPLQKYDNIADKLMEYVTKTRIPILAEFAYKNKVTREYLYTLSEKDEQLFNAIKYCVLKKEAVLEKGALTGSLDHTMAIFSLKQLGWKDKPEEKDDRAVSILSDMLKAMKGVADGELSDSDTEAE